MFQCFLNTIAKMFSFFIIPTQLQFNISLSHAEYFYFSCTLVFAFLSFVYHTTYVFGFFPAEKALGAFFCNFTTPHLL